MFWIVNLWCHCYCCFLLMKSINKLWGLFFYRSEKKNIGNIGLHPNLIQVGDQFPKQTNCSVLFRFFFSLILVLFLNFFEFFLFYYFLFWWGRGVFLSIACARLLITSKRKITSFYVFVFECILHRELIMNEKKFLKDIYDQKC